MSHSHRGKTMAFSSEEFGAEAVAKASSPRLPRVWMSVPLGVRVVAEVEDLWDECDDEFDDDDEDYSDEGD